MIRALDHADLPALIALDQASNPHPWTAAQWQGSLTQHACWGHEENGQLLAFAIWQCLPDEAELLLLATAPTARRRGLARALLQHGQTLVAQRPASLLLEVRASNLGAQALYQAQGFTLCGVRRNYYPKPDGSREDAQLWRQELPA